MQIAVSDIKLWDANYRQGDVGMIKRSLQQFGYNRSIALWRDNVTIAGNHVTQALQELEQAQADPPINITVVDGDWVIDVMDVSHLDDTQAQAYAIADNRASDTATNDDEQLALLLQQLQQEDEALFEAAGYDNDDINELIQSLLIPDEFPEYTESIADTVDMCTCPECGHEFPK